MASSIAMDKIMTKRIWRFEGCPRLTGAWSRAPTNACMPCRFWGAHDRQASPRRFVHWPDQSDRPAQCAAAYAAAAQHDPEVLCEQFIDGDETTCPVLIVNGQPQALPLIRIVAPDGNYDYQNKYFTDDGSTCAPASSTPTKRPRLLVKWCARSRPLGCRGWARADVMIRRSDRQPFLLEINTAPRHDQPLFGAHVCPRGWADI